MDDWDEEWDEEWDEPPRRRGRSLGVKLGLGCAVMLGVIILGLAALGVLLQLGRIPDIAVVPGDRLSEDVVQMLQDEGVLEAGETIQYFYSAGLFSFRKDGNFLTERRVVSYFEEEDELVISAAQYGEITEVDPTYSESFFEDTIVWIHVDGWEPFNLLLSNEEDLDHVFVDALLERWHAAR